MYKLIDATTEHAQQIIHYLSKTCYWKEFIEGNTLNLPYEEFMLEWIVLPRIKLTKVLISPDDPGKIHGCLIAATSDEFGNMPDYTPYLDPNVMEVFKTWFTYPVSDSIILELYAVDKELKGKGFGTLMLNTVDEIAAYHNKETISCFVWTCFHDSIIATTKKGFTIVDCLKFPEPINIGLLYMEKSSDLICKKDYFQSNQYIALKGLLLNDKQKN